MEINWSELDELRRRLSNPDGFGESVVVSTKSRRRAKLSFILSFMVYGLVLKIFSDTGYIEFIWPVWVVAHAYVAFPWTSASFLLPVAVADLGFFAVGVCLAVRSLFEKRQVTLRYLEYQASGTVCWPVFPLTGRGPHVLTLTYKSFLHSLAVLVDLSGERREVESRLREAAEYLDESSASSAEGKAEWEQLSADVLRTGRHADGSAPLFSARRLWPSARDDMWIASRQYVDCETEPLVVVSGSESGCRGYRLRSEALYGWYVSSGESRVERRRRERRLSSEGRNE